MILPDGGGFVRVAHGDGRQGHATGRQRLGSVPVAGEAAAFEHAVKQRLGDGEIQGIDDAEFLGHDHAFHRRVGGFGRQVFHGYVVSVVVAIDFIEGVRIVVGCGRYRGGRNLRNSSGSQMINLVI